MQPETHPEPSLSQAPLQLWQPSLWQHLCFPVFFAEGQDTLNQSTRKRLVLLAQHLTSSHPSHIHLQGHSDAHGTDEYNNVLSRERAASVAQVLLEMGVQPGCIHLTGEGNRFARAGGGVRGYGFDRRVDIKLSATKIAGTL